MSTPVCSVLDNNGLDQSREAVRVIVFQGKFLPVESVLLRAKEFSVFELTKYIELDGKKVKRLAVTTDEKLYSIDAFAGRQNLLTVCHGSAKIDWI